MRLRRVQFLAEIASPPMCELVVSLGEPFDSRADVNFGDVVAFMLGLRLDVAIRMPWYSDGSWTTIAVAEKSSRKLEYLMFDTFANRAADAGDRSPTIEEFLWACDSAVAFLNNGLQADTKVANARDALQNYFKIGHSRLEMSLIWSAIEGLLGTSQEATFRTSLAIATLTEPPGHSRSDAYRKAKALYDARSRAVHGHALDARRLRSQVRESRGLLRRILLAVIGLSRVPAPDELIDWLLCGASATDDALSPREVAEGPEDEASPAS
jgi:Apea-like HEPN